MPPGPSAGDAGPSRQGGLVEGVRSLGARAGSRIVDRFFEQRYGTETAAEASLDGLAHPDRVPYTPAGWLTLRYVLGRLDVSPEDVFLDLGSGKGRAVLLAGRLPFKRVIGVEISRYLHTIAETNLRRNRGRLKCRNIDLVNSDVLDFPIPEDVTVVFLFNPFRGELFSRVVQQLLGSIDARPRAVVLIYVNPFEEESLLATGRAKLIEAVHSRSGSEHRVYRLS